MSWYLGQSWLIILLSVLLGVLIGWALWRRPWHKRYVSESEVLSQLTAEHARASSAQDAEIARLRALLDAGSVEEAAPAGSSGTGGVGADRVESQPAEADRRETDEPEPQGRPRTEPQADQDVAAPAAVGATEPTGPTSRPGPTGPAGPTAPAEAQQGAASVVVVDDAPTDGIDRGAPGTGADAAQTADRGAEVGQTEPAGEDGEDGEDDLERIEGIGPRIAGALSSAGITTFSTLAESDVGTLQSALEAAGLRFAPSLPTWSRQARLLADGDEAGFRELSEQLLAGRDVGRRA